MKEPATLCPLNWHCIRFAPNHHLFQHPLSPYDEKSAQDVAKLVPRMKEQASTATSTTHPLFMTTFTPEERGWGAYTTPHGGGIGQIIHVSS